MNRKNFPAAALAALTAAALAVSCAGPSKASPESAGAAGTRADASIPEHYSKLAFPEFAYVPPHPKDHRVVLDRGVVAYLVPDTALALIQMTVLFGNTNLPSKPPETASLNLYSSLLKAGGTVRFTPERLEDSLEFVAAGLGAGIGDFQASLSLDALRKDAYALFDLLPELALKPRLDPEVFKVQKRGYLENIRHRYDTPRGVMGPAYEHVLYGSHPGNWRPLEKEVEAVSVAGLKPLIGRGFAAKDMVIGVAGQFDRDEMIAHLNRLIARFPEEYKNPADSVPPYPGPQAPGVYIVDKPFEQTTIRIGAPGVKRPDPDYYRLVVASYIFGDGGFTSRLVEKIRSSEGLAYGVDSDVGSDYYRRSTVGVSLQTKVETGAYAVKLVLSEMERMGKEGITDAELQRAKDGLVKSLPAMFATASATAQAFAQGEIWKRSPDHYTRYVETIEKMTKAEVEDAFRRYFNPDSMRIVVVGAKDALLKADERNQAAFSQFGPVKELTLREIESRK